MNKDKVITFKDAYQLPLKYDEGSSKVFTKEYNMAFDFPFMRGMFEGKEEILLDEKQKEEIVSIINGEKQGKIDGEIQYNKNNATITFDGKILLVIRGWGYLTGTGGLKMSPEKAAEIQDDFGEFITKRLKGE